MASLGLRSPLYEGSNTSTTHSPCLHRLTGCKTLQQPRPVPSSWGANGDVPATHRRHLTQGDGVAMGEGQEVQARRRQHPRRTLWADHRSEQGPSGRGHALSWGPTPWTTAAVGHLWRPRVIGPRPGPQSTVVQGALEDTSVLIHAREHLELAYFSLLGHYNKVLLEEGAP